MKKLLYNMFEYMYEEKCNIILFCIYKRSYNLLEISFILLYFDMPF